MEPKEIPSCLIPRLLVVFTGQLEIFYDSPVESKILDLTWSNYFGWRGVQRASLRSILHYENSVLFNRTLKRFVVGHEKKKQQQLHP